MGDKNNGMLIPPRLSAAVTKNKRARRKVLSPSGPPSFHALMEQVEQKRAHLMQPTIATHFPERATPQGDYRLQVFEEAFVLSELAAKVVEPNKDLRDTLKKTYIDCLEKSILGEGEIRNGHNHELYEATATDIANQISQLIGRTVDTATANAKTYDQVALAVTAERGIAVAAKNENSPRSIQNWYNVQMKEDSYLLARLAQKAVGGTIPGLATARRAYVESIATFKAGTQPAQVYLHSAEAVVRKVDAVIDRLVPDRAAAR